jgi:hypothetical protein
MEMSDLIYHEVTEEDQPGPVNLFILEPSPGPVRALRLHHPTKTWKFDPVTVRYSLIEDFDQGDDLIWQVDRTRAEKVALLLGAPLPSETQLHQLMQDGASAATG